MGINPWIARRYVNVQKHKQDPIQGNMMVENTTIHEEQNTSFNCLVKRELRGEVDS